MSSYLDFVNKWIHFHAFKRREVFNEVTGEHEYVKGLRGWLKGRFSLSARDKDRPAVSAEWDFMPFWDKSNQRFSVGANLGPGMMTDGDDYAVCLNVCVPGFSVYLTLTGIIPRALIPGGRVIGKRQYREGGPVYNIYSPGRSVGISLCERSIQVRIWQNQDGDWSAKNPWWDQCFSIDLEDLFLGKAELFTEYLNCEKNPVPIPLPEGTYWASVQRVRRTWKRKFKTIVRTNYEFEEFIGPDGQNRGLPFPGKGENSWDCGMDGFFGISGADGMGLYESIGHLVRRVMEQRKKTAYDPFWTPEAASYPNGNLTAE